jgi:tetratricopeptide (TPR) repeat protein
MFVFMKYAFCLLLFAGYAQAETPVAANQDEQLKLGLSLIQEKKYQQAETYFEKLKNEYPGQITYLNNLAVAQMAQGKAESALDNLKTATISDKYYSVMQKNISDIYAYMASQAYSKALEKQQTPSLPTLASISDVKLLVVPLSDVEEQAELPAVAEVDTDKQLQETIESNVVVWANAWMKGDSNVYVATYSKHFKPANNLSYKDWLAQRRYRLRHSKQVEISYNQLNIFFNVEKTTAIMEFVQHYKAGKYQDKVRKQLYWQLENDSWLIAREQVIEKL